MHSWACMRCKGNTQTGKQAGGFRKGQQTSREKKSDTARETRWNMKRSFCVYLTGDQSVAAASWTPAPAWDCVWASEPACLTVCFDDGVLVELKEWVSEWATEPGGTVWEEKWADFLPQLQSHSQFPFLSVREDIILCKGHIADGNLGLTVRWERHAE